MAINKKMLNKKNSSDKTISFHSSFTQFLSNNKKARIFYDLILLSNIEACSILLT
jgi:hypothetical protein